jgi:HK97 family phage major capsid protein
MYAETREPGDLNVEEARAALAEIDAELPELESRARLSADERDRRALLTRHRAALMVRMQEHEKQVAAVARMRAEGRVWSEPGATFPGIESASVPLDVRHDVREAVVGAMRGLDGLVRSGEIGADGAVAVERLIKSDRRGNAAAYVAATADAAYRTAFTKLLARPRLDTLMLSDSERNAVARVDVERSALGLGGTAGYAVPIALDPTVIATSAGSTSAIRQIARGVNITGSEWKGVTSGGGGGASYDAEAAVVSDDTPSLGQPVIHVEKAQSYFQYSIESEDWAGLTEELTRLFLDERDSLEATKFVTGAGHGSHEPEGLLTGLSNAYEVASDAINSLGPDDIYRLKAELPPRHQARASWLASGPILDHVYRLVGKADNEEPKLWRDGDPPTILRRPAFEASGMSATIDGDEKVLVLGDFSNFVIVDRLGAAVEPVPLVMDASTQRPTGQRGLYFYWRNSAGVVNPNAFRVLCVQSS